MGDSRSPEYALGNVVVRGAATEEAVKKARKALGELARTLVQYGQSDVEAPRTGGLIPK